MSNLPSSRRETFRVPEEEEEEAEMSHPSDHDDDTTRDSFHATFASGHERYESKTSVFDPLTPLPVRRLTAPIEDPKQMPSTDRDTRKHKNGYHALQTGTSKGQKSSQKYEAIEMRDVVIDSLSDIGTENDSDTGSQSSEEEEAQDKVSRNWIKSVLAWIKGASVFLFSLWQFAALAYVIMEVLGAILLKEWAVAEVEANFNEVRKRNSSSYSGPSKHDININYFSKYCAVKLGSFYLPFWNFLALQHYTREYFNWVEFHRFRLSFRQKLYWIPQTIIELQLARDDQNFLSYYFHIRETSCLAIPCAQKIVWNLYDETFSIYENCMTSFFSMNQKFDFFSNSISENFGSCS